jgi:hypothetical protein
MPCPCCSCVSCQIRWEQMLGCEFERRSKLYLCNITTYMTLFVSDKDMHVFVCCSVLHIYARDIISHICLAEKSFLLIWLMHMSAAVLHLCAAVLHPIATGRSYYALNCHMHHVLLFWHSVQHPTAGMDVGGGPKSHLNIWTLTFMSKLEL